IRNVVDAHVRTTTGVGARAQGGVSVLANDVSQLNSVVPAGAGAGTAAIGAGLATNDIRNRVDAFAEQATVTAVYGPVEVDAVERARILNATVGGAGAGTFALGGAVSLNFIRNVVDAHALTSTVTAFGRVGLLAQDTSSISVIAGA